MANEPPDIFFKYAKVPKTGLENGRQLGPFLYAAPGKLWLHVPGIARFMVLDGKEILVDPLPAADEDSLRVFLLGSCIGALLMQRQLLVLRGCAIRVGNGSLVCLGDSAAGKSTLAAALMQRGHTILSDDVVAIDRDNRAIPGFPTIKLWREATEKLALPTEGLRRVRPGIEKYQVPLDGFFQIEPLPVRWVYVLQPHHASLGFSLENIPGMERFSVLLENSYRPLYLDGMKLKAGQLKPCANLAGKIQLKCLTRPEQPWLVSELADFILEDIGAFG